MRPADPVSPLGEPRPTPAATPSDDDEYEYVPVRDDNGWGQLRMERVKKYVPTPESTAQLLNTLSKAWPVLAEHANWMDGTFDLALTQLRRDVEALHQAVARRDARLRSTPDRAEADDAALGAALREALATAMPCDMLTLYLSRRGSVVVRVQDPMWEREPETDATRTLASLLSRAAQPAKEDG